MNRDKIEAMRRKFMADESEPGSKADAQLYVENMLELLDALLEDDEQPRVDRSLRGWVLVEDQLDFPTVYWADYDGLAEGEGVPVLYSWDNVENDKWTVRKLTEEDL